MPWSGIGASGGRAVSQSDNSRKHALECLRMEADCLHLAREVDSPTLQSYFTNQAKEWSALADASMNSDREESNEP